MQQIADLHIHSKYSRACSQQLVPEMIDKYCRIKGIDIISCSDFTHPAWFKQLNDELEEIGSTGLYKHKKAKDDKAKFFISTEAACIYSKNERVRRLHICIFAPNLKIAGEINKTLEKAGGKLGSDGRPILGMDAKRLAEICFDISKDCMIIPAHAWTPWFGIFGSKSGFDSIQECFEELTPFIYSIETGLSSDPEMNWRLSVLDNITLISNSDAHSLPNIGRECNVFNLEQITYKEICDAIKNKDSKKLLKTVEFYPEEGMYHYDGHRLCGISYEPSETKKHKGICPVCKKSLVIGVMNRVEELADRKQGYKPENAIPFVKLVELDKIISDGLAIKNRNAKGVQEVYGKMIKGGKDEMNILLNLSYDELEKFCHPAILEGIKRVREGRLVVEPGFDGQYGKIKIFNDDEKINKKQKSLF